MEKQTIIKNTLTVIGIGVGVYLFFKYLFTLFLPFIIAFILAFLLNYPVTLIKKRTGMRSGFLSAVFVLVLVFLIGFFIFLLTNRIITEVRGIIISLTENSDKYVQGAFDFINGIAKKLPFIDALGTDLTEMVSDVVRNMITEITSRLPSFIASIIAMIPHILLFTVIIILATYYFCADFSIIKERLISILPKGAKNAIRTFKKRLMSTGIKYLKSCLIIMVITYFEVLVGFLMLDIPYAFTFSLVVAAVDMLPIFGVGTALVPFAVWCMLSGDTYTAIGLLIIFAVITVVRQFIEPKIIGTGIGLSPLTTLFSMYIGFRFFGLIGLLFSPLAAVLIINALPDNIATKLGFNQDKSKNTKKS